MDEQIIMQEEVGAANVEMENTEASGGFGKKLLVGGAIVTGLTLVGVGVVKGAKAINKYVIQPVAAKIKSKFSKAEEAKTDDPEWDEACATMEAIKREGDED